MVDKDKFVLDNQPSPEDQERLEILRAEIEALELIPLLKHLMEMYGLTGNQIEVSAQMGQGVFSKIMNGVHREFKPEHVENLIKDLQYQGKMTDPDEALLWDQTLRVQSLLHNISYKTLEPRLRRIKDPKEREETLVKLLEELYPALVRAYEKLEGRLPAFAPFSFSLAKQVLEKWGWIKVPEGYELKKATDSYYYLINYDLFPPKIENLGPGLRIKDTGWGTYTVYRDSPIGVEGVVPKEPASQDKPAGDPDRRPSRRTDRFIEPELVRVPAGSFWMGSQIDDPDAFDNEKPMHQVYLAEFWMGRFPVTNEEYHYFLLDNPFHEEPISWKEINPLGREKHPVGGVSWNDAMDYCRWLSRITGREYTLPSEAEWEKAARGTNGWKYPWGDRFDKFKLNSSESEIYDSTPVGSFSPAGDSPFGCADIAGNVNEWTRSPYIEGRFSTDSPAWRGGSFAEDYRDVRCAHRGGIFIFPPPVTFGFRVMVSPFVSEP